MYKVYPSGNVYLFNYHTGAYDCFIGNLGFSTLEEFIAANKERFTELLEVC